MTKLTGMTKVATGQVWDSQSSMNGSEGTLLYLINDLGRLLIFGNFPHLVALITSWSLILFWDFILLVANFIVVADQVDIALWSAITSRLPTRMS